MRTACCLLILLLPALTADAQRPKKRKSIGRSFEGTVFDYRPPKGGDSGRMVLRLVTRTQDQEGKLHYQYKELTFSPHLCDGKTDPTVPESQRWRYPHLPKHLKDGALIEVFTDPEPDRQGRFVVRGIHADRKKLQKEFQERIGMMKPAKEKAKD